jgi:hypothetical protein
MKEWQREWRYWVRCADDVVRHFFTGRGANRWHDRQVARGVICESGPRADDESEEAA